MKRLLLLAIILLGLAFPSKIFALENWEIKNFQSEITIEKSGIVRVTETITVDFRSLSKHGIYREIPYIYEKQDSEREYTEIVVLSVSRDNKAEKYSISSNGGFVRMKIGDEDVTISGEHEYRLTYTATGVLRSFDTYDEFYWNSTGDHWEVPIEKASTTVSLPKNKIDQAACYQGVSGSTELCQANIEASTSVVFSSQGLTPGEGMTIAVGYTKGTVPILVGKKPKEVTDDLFSPLSLTIFFVTLVLGLFSVVLLWLGKGRDYWFKARFLNDPHSRSEVRSVGAHETIVVEFTPPEGLRPGEIGTILDEDVNHIEVTATLIDLANRGYLIINEEKKKWLFGSTDYIFKKIKSELDSLLQYEIDLLTAIFKAGDEVKLSHLKNKFYKDLPEIKKHLYQDLVDKGYFVENPSSVRLRYLLIGVGVTIVAGVLVWLGFLAILAYLVTFGAALLLVGLSAIIFSRFMPRKTAIGRQMFVRAQGYKMFIERAEKYRQQFFEKKNLFNEILPYAIVFGVTEKFAKAFEKMGIEPESPSWYHGSSVFNAAVFGASMESFSNSFSSTIASSPSSSGSGGGGSSGGGFGGGGGGSW